MNFAPAHSPFEESAPEFADVREAAALAAAVGPMADILGETEPADTAYRTMRLRLKPEATVRETVTAVNETVELRSFGEVMPSMNEIFIRAVEGTL